jgi:hypothetical protein
MYQQTNVVCRCCRQNRLWQVPGGLVCPSCDGGLLGNIVAANNASADG